MLPAAAHLCLFLVLVSINVGLALSAPSITLCIDDKVTGAFSIFANGVEWLRSFDHFVSRSGTIYSTKDHSLVLENIGTADGSDAFGLFHATKFRYNAAGSRITYAIKMYSDSSAVVFEQHFIDTFENTSVGNADGLISGFPNFHIGDAQESDSSPAAFVHWVSWYYEPNAPGVHSKLVAPGFKNPYYGAWNSTAKFPGGIAGSGVTAVLSRDLSMLVTISPLDQPMACSHTMPPEGGSLQYGVMGSVNSVAKDTVFRFVASFSSAGFTAGVRQWGTMMRQWFGKAEAKFARQQDVTLQYIGYTTDNGMYYYYHTAGNSTYQDTLTMVHKYATANQIPYAYVLLDSWWYYRGITNGVTNWTERPDVFPAGLAELYSQTGWLVQAHNRYWGPDTVYAKQNGGNYNFLIDSVGAVPDDSAFWSDLFRGPKASWGLHVYEQDWLNQEFGLWAASVFLSDVTRGKTWLRQMNDGAAVNGINIQYCMPNIRHVLASVQFSAVTQARASDDAIVAQRTYGLENWRIGAQSLLFDSLGLAASKDGFWSSTSQPGNPYGDSVIEPTPRLQSAVATLSAGPVAIGDGVGYTDRALVMRSCRADGRLLQPSRPATSLDSTVLDRALGDLAKLPADAVRGEVWFAPSGGAQEPTFGDRVFGTLLVIELSQAASVRPADLGLSHSTSYWAIESNWTATSPSHLSTTKPLKLPPVASIWDFQTWTIAPVEAIGGWAFLGEINKWTAVSAARFIGIDAFETGMLVRAVGASGEIVSVAFVDPHGSIVKVTCVIGDAQTMDIGSDSSCTP